jgi:flagellar M-ring protein FliF
MELTSEAEMAIERRVASLLERTAGPGAVDVRVKLQLDTTTRERTEEHYEPTKTALRSEHKTEELTGVEGATVAGVPGAQTNLPDVAPTVETTEAGGDGNLARRSHTRNWEIDRVVEKILTPAGDVRRISIAVMVDGRYETKDDQQIYTPRTPQELEAYSNIVRGAVGFDAARGDTLELQQLRFARPELENTDGADVASGPAWLKYWPYAGAAFGAMFILSALLLLKRKRAQKEKALAQLAAAQEADDLPRFAQAEARLLDQQLDEQAALHDPELALRRRTEALEIATSDPATAAIVLRQWLHSTELKGAVTPNA